MQNLHDYLGLLIEERETNPYQISKNTGIERTSLQRVLKGQRIPSKQVVKTLINYLNLTPSQTEKILDLYEKKKLGNKVYNNRKYIKKMIEDINQISEKTTTLSNHFNTHIDINNNNDTVVINGKLDVESYLYGLIYHEINSHDVAELYTNFPPTYKFFMESVLKAYAISDNNECKINHVFSMIKNTNIAEDNNYKPYYYYMQNEISTINQLPLPYYLFSNNLLIQLSGDYNTLIIQKNNNIINYYRSHYEKTLTNCFSLIENFDTPLDYLKKYVSLLNYNSCNALFSGPTLPMYFTNKLIEKKVIKDMLYRDEFVNLASEMYTKYGSQKSEALNYLSIEGLINFAKTGYLMDIPSEFIYDFTNQEKYDLIKSYYNDILSNTLYSRLIDTSKLKTTQYTIFSSYVKNYICIASRIKGNDIISIFFNETSIHEAFVDYFLSLKDSEYILSKEETLSAIQKVLDDLETSL